MLVPVVPDQSMHISVGSDQPSHVPVDPNQSSHDFDQSLQVTSDQSKYGSNVADAKLLHGSIVTDRQSNDSIVAEDQSLQGFIVPERSRNTGYNTDQLLLNGLSGSDHLRFGSVVPKEVVDNGVITSFLLKLIGSK